MLPRFTNPSCKYLTNSLLWYYKYEPRSTLVGLVVHVLLIRARVYHHLHEWCIKSTIMRHVHSYTNKSHGIPWWWTSNLWQLGCGAYSGTILRGLQILFGVAAPAVIKMCYQLATKCWKFWKLRISLGEVWHWCSKSYARHNSYVIFGSFFRRSRH